MDNYKKTLRIRIAILTLPALISVALGIYDVFFASEAVKDSFIFGFQIGFTTALGILSMIIIMRYRMIMNDKMKLQLQYNKENDERLKAVRAKAGLPVLLITSVGMVIAGIIVGYFSQTAFIALSAAAVCQLLIAGIIKQIHLRKM